MLTGEINVQFYGGMVHALTNADSLAGLHAYLDEPETRQITELMEDGEPD